jgi:hypothetical protein
MPTKTLTKTKAKYHKVDPIIPTIPDDEHDELEAQEQHVWDGLPCQAFAIVPVIADPSTWKLPHHTRQVYRAVKGKVGYEHTVDWENMPLMVQYLSHNGVDGQRVQGEPSDLLAAAKHLASHYIKAGKPLPDALAVIV